MASQSPHPRISSAYAKEPSVSRTLLASSHQRSNSLSSACLPRVRYSSKQAPFIRSHRQDLPIDVDESTDHLIPFVFQTELVGGNIQHDEPDTASIIAVKSREMLKEEASTNQTGGRRMSSVDKLVVSSWGGGRRKCLDTLLTVDARFRVKNTEYEPASSTGRQGLKPQINNDRQGGDMGRQLDEHPTRSIAWRPITTATPIRSLRHTGNMNTGTLGLRRRCSSLQSQLPEPVKVEPFSGDVAHDKGWNSVAPLRIQKKNAALNSMGADYPAGARRQTNDRTRQSNPTQGAGQINKQPSFEAISSAVGPFNRWMRSVTPDSGFRATRCPPSIRGDPKNRI
ncbi:hypothetical protein M408DRAFT_21298 [Serendipita vermifera MAFF 305830]|uniref:Uncharacterized protein n=1 Tax=Serendipita vermifera MAFF 305830 TaxID=933852 RepID=A0A0C3BGF3_SERVB|nr:hypothetical protein M408DRAFT_21298 [Serendipita vermifera MAFF 305830]